MMGWEDAATEWNAMGQERRRETMRATLADLCADAWLDLLDAIYSEKMERNADGERDE